MPQIGVKAGQADRPRRRATRRHRSSSGASRGFNIASSIASTIQHHPRAVAQRHTPTRSFTPHRSYTPRSSSSPRPSGGASGRYQRTERRYNKTRQNFAATNALATAFLSAGDIVRLADPKLVHGYHATIDPIAAHDYQRYSRDLWQQAKRYYPQRAGEQPTAKIEAMPGDAGLTTQTRSGPKVSYSPDTAGAWEHTQNDFLRRYAEQVPLHEWAHYGQGLTGTVRTMPRSLVEGGADALRQYVARQLGYPKVPSGTKEYAQFTQDARRLGLGWVLRGQFTPKS